MSARRFEADSTPAAFEAVRAAFGENAFILSNRRVGERVEVIASRDAEPLPESECDTGGTSDAEVVQGSSLDVRDPTQRTTSVDFDAVADSHEERPSPDGASVAPEPAMVDAAVLANLEGIGARLRRMELGLWGERDDARATALSQLLQLGLGAHTARRLVESVPVTNSSDVMRAALADLAKELPLDAGQAGARVTMLVGPDGDARRELLLQLAAQAVDGAGRGSVVLLCADAGTPGAFESLEAAAHTLGCIAIRLRADDSLAVRLAALDDQATVLIDGGERWPECRPERCASSVRWLVLPTTLQRSVARAEVARAIAAGADGCALTRLDAAGRPGECLDALLEHWLPIVCWNDGRAPSQAPRPAAGPLLVAAAVAGARRLGEPSHDRALAELLHPPAASHGAAAAMPSGRVDLRAEADARHAAGVR